MSRTLQIARMAVFAAVALLAIPQLGAQDLGLYEVLARPILAPNQPTVEVQVYTATRVPALPAFRKLDEWEAYAKEIRQRTFDEVIFRGEARAWRDAKTRVEWLETIPGGPGYRIKKLRFEAVPGLWIPALLYEPENLSGKVPVVLNVNGHDRPDGKAADYKQIRCINQAKRGMLSMNVEWLGMGQLNTPGFDHTRMNQLDLLGTSGIAPFYLSMKRSLDVLLAHENADPERVAVAGLSGGGWQTIFISSLDERVTLANSVAGYSSFVTRTQFPKPDLGDSEQTPSDLASIADYTHLTALRAPRATLITNNARDTCCFRADYAQAPLLQSAHPIFELYDRPGHLRGHVNHDAGHNFGQDNREALYRMFKDFFYGGSPKFSVDEIDVTSELKTKEDLTVALPADNLDFHQLAMRLAEGLPRGAAPPTDKAALEAWQRTGREKLREVTRTPRFHVEAKSVHEETVLGTKATSWQLQMGDWTVPAVELTRGASSGTVILLSDGGRKSVAGEARQWLDKGRRVIALDPFYFGESAIESEDWLFAILIASLGERPLGIQAGQIAAAAQWAQSHDGKPVEIHAVGARLSLAALVAGALEPLAISGLRLEESFGSLREIVERDLGVDQAPELFCFGLLEAFDIKQLVALAAPTPVEFPR
ncbi:MAG: acetylxylan esterase [Acidobacteria bacterium]|nr:acetylxylan esterase [Acidobacteriota bacterium]